MLSFLNLEGHFYRRKAQIEFMGLVKDPKNTPNIFALTDSIKKSKSPEEIDRMMSLVYADPEMNRSFESKYWPQLPSWREVKTMPQGTFGFEYRVFFEKWNLDPDFYPEPKLDTPENYLLSRIYQAHDAWHVLTGYTPSVKDEIALQAFGVAQYKQPISALIVAGGLLHMLNNHSEAADQVLEAISEGYRRGKKASNLLTHPVLERFADPIEDVRKDLGLI